MGLRVKLELWLAVELLRSQVLKREGIFDQLGQAALRSSALLRDRLILLVVDATQQVSNLLKALETALVHRPLPILAVFGELGQRKQHAQLVESVLIAIGLHLLHHELKILTIHLRAGENLQIMLFLYLENSALQIELAFAGHSFQQIFHLGPAALQNELSKEANLLRVPEK